MNKIVRGLYQKSLHLSIFRSRKLIYYGIVSGEGENKVYKLGSLELYRFATLPKVKLILQKGAKMTFTLNHRAFVVIEKGSVSYHMLSGTKKIFGPEESHDAVLVPAYYHQQWFIREPNTCVSILFKEDLIRTMLAELAVLPN